MRRDSTRNTENTPSLLADLSVQERRDECDVLEVAPQRREERRAKSGDRRRETVYDTGRGSLYEKGEEERRRRRKSRVGL
jgi:hypothetical protein